MILIADSGSTKTDWMLTDGNGTRQTSGTLGTLVHTQGINPFHQTAEEISDILRTELLPQVDVEQVRSVCFYGSGVRPELEPLMSRLLGDAFLKAEAVEAHNDLLGAARALCGRKQGIASILGTGANSCLYDGERIMENTPPLGYILGDEGSGAVLGRRFLNALYKGVLSKEMKVCFQEKSGLSMANVIDRVYRKSLANRFLASLCPFIHEHLDDEAVCRLVTDCFRDFFRLNIAPYGRPDLPVSFVGSVAWHFGEQLREAARQEGFTVGDVVQSPLEGLLRYHLD